MFVECCTYAVLESLRRLIPRLNQTGSLLLLNFKAWQRTSETESMRFVEGTSPHTGRVDRHDDSAKTYETLYGHIHALAMCGLLFLDDSR